MELPAVQLEGQTLHLHPFRGAYWEEESVLLLADLHLGKTSHFRRHGLPVPRAVSDENWDRLIAMIVDFSPERVLFLGDLFHSEYNAEWEELNDLIEQFATIQFELVPGNHDILEGHHYERSLLIVHPETLTEPPFLFSHHPLEDVPAGLYNLAGHLHPGVRLRGNGRQRLRLPCFYFGQNQGILPAFGAFTGLGKIEVKEGDRVFVIAEGEVVGI